MADVPQIRSQADFLNHIRRVLDSELQRWEFDHVEGLNASVLFLGSKHSVDISYENGRWDVSSFNYGLADRLTGLLNGLVRDATGQMVQR